MKNYRNYLYLLILLVLFSIGCARQELVKDQDDTEIVTDITDLEVPDAFNYTTSRNVTFSVQTLDALSKPIAGVRIDVYHDNPENEEANNALIFSGNTDNMGHINFSLRLANYLHIVYLGTDYIGYPNSVEVNIENNEVAYIFGGALPSLNLKSANTNNDSYQITDGPVYHYMGTYDDAGVPDYLIERDYIDPEFYNDINATFPEYQPVPDYHPQYLDDVYTHNLILDQPADVWVTFVHEGAGYKNTLAYYSYLADDPPQSIDDVDTLNIVFPNASFAGSGGGLYSGDKVYLGQFAPNTVIAWCLISNAYNSSQHIVTDGIEKYYSDKWLNPEADPLIQQHVVLLNDNGRDLFILGFEDLRRDGHCDNDFNDAMFYVTANPIVAVETQDLGVIEYTSSDADNDGVSDNFDDYPNDPSKAFNNYYPDQETYSTLAFEDLWPGRGDYDFNDLVLDYRFLQVLNSNNQVVELQAEFLVKAIGASQRNGFAFELPIAHELIADVSGQVIEDAYIPLNANNTEAGLTNTVIVVFDDAYNVLQYPGSGTGINTEPTAPYVEPVAVSLTVSFVQPIALNEIGTPPFNPFLIINKNRSKEVHLPNQAPTEKADINLFGTMNDDSNPEIGRYYKTANNLPWAINIIESFDYPIERVSIIEGHLKFADWAESGGQNFYDWFQPNTSYRNTDKLFQAQ